MSKLFWFVWRFIPHTHGVDDMTLIEKMPESFGSYEIWECNKCKFREAL